MQYRASTGSNNGSSDNNGSTNSKEYDMENMKYAEVESDTKKRLIWLVKNSKFTLSQIANQLNIGYGKLVSISGGNTNKMQLTQLFILVQFLDAQNIPADLKNLKSRIVDEPRKQITDAFRFKLDELIKANRDVYQYQISEQIDVSQIQLSEIKTGSLKNAKIEIWNKINAFIQNPKSVFEAIRSEINPVSITLEFQTRVIKMIDTLSTNDETRFSQMQIMSEEVGTVSQYVWKQIWFRQVKSISVKEHRQITEMLKSFEVATQDQEPIQQEMIQQKWVKEQEQQSASKQEPISQSEPKLPKNGTKQNRRNKSYQLIWHKLNKLIKEGITVDDMFKWCSLTKAQLNNIINGKTETVNKSTVNSVNSMLLKLDKIKVAKAENQQFIGNYNFNHFEFIENAKMCQIMRYLLDKVTPEKQSFSTKLSIIEKETGMIKRIVRTTLKNFQDAGYIKISGSQYLTTVHISDYDSFVQKPNESLTELPTESQIDQFIESLETAKEIPTETLIETQVESVELPVESSIIPANYPENIIDITASIKPDSKSAEQLIKDIQKLINPDIDKLKSEYAALQKLSNELLDNSDEEIANLKRQLVSANAQIVSANAQIVSANAQVNNANALKNKFKALVDSM